ncbi:MAG TPA: NAD(P)/FAD-dependent oxidoreductase [Gemmatimonadaceae bacterium]|nr:NAD(P)/FAD-dependent oxidoreductase [Gemmatimonadaceae bacterium]
MTERRGPERGAREVVETFDVVIVGGGPAGLSAAIWLGRYLHRVALVDSGDPRNWETRGVNGFLGFPAVRPAELRGAGRDECRSYGVTLLDGFVTRVRAEAAERLVVEYDPLPVTKASADLPGPGAPRAPEDNERRPETRVVVGRRLLLAFGLKDEWPKVPGLRQVYGSGAHVCPDCDGYDARDRRVVVIAAGRKAAGMALNLTTWTDDIVICTNGAPAELAEPLAAKLAALDILIHTDAITCVRAEGDAVESVELAGGRQVECDEIFFALSQRPADDLGAQLGCARDDQGHVVVDSHQHTSVSNVYAAGDITPGPQLAIRAAAHGAVAALAIHRSLVPDNRKIG